MRSLGNDIVLGADRCKKPDASRLGFLPAWVVTFKSVPEFDLLRGSKAQCRVVNFEITCKSGQAYVRRWRIALAVGKELFYLNGRGNTVKAANGAD